MPKRYVLDGQYNAWNITKVVGYSGGASNNDVKLVQFLLNAYKKYMEVTGTEIPSKWLAVDGIFGPNTSTALVTMQKRQQGRLVMDGKASQMQGNAGIIGGSKAVWSVAYLEVSYTHFVHKLGRNDNMSAAQFNSAMDQLRYDPVLDVSVRTEMLAG